MEPIARESLDELKAIFAWVRDRESSLENPVTVLVGGWAVYSYNNYWGSIDIDLITNNRKKKSLKKFLLDHRDYHPDPETANSVFKDTIHGQVVIDIANRGEDRFEGHSNSLGLDVVDERAEIRDIEDQEVIVPSRTVMLMMKFKAAWDRDWRIRNDRSDDPDHDRFKLIKDHSDILALSDPLKGGDDIDIQLLGSYFSQYSFAGKVFDDIIGSNSASEKYGIDHDTASNNIEILKGLII